MPSKESKRDHHEFPWKGLLVIVVLGLVKIVVGQQNNGPYAWMTYDAFDDIDDRMNAVNAQNCKSKPATELRLPADTVAQQPQFNRLLSYIVYPNRTKLLQCHNMALNRAFFYSYIFQKLNTTDTFFMQPGLLYYYFSVAADVSANPNNINASGIFFDNNASFANWYRTLPFNRTLPLFGPRAYLFDDYNEPTNWIREPTNHTINQVDYGAGPQSNYTTKAYKINQWYDLFLPDGWNQKGQDSQSKMTYTIGIKYSNETGKFTPDEFQGKTIFGPPSPGQMDTQYLPVLFTEPFFDCGKSNRWIVSAVSPVVDQVPRYLDWFHLRREQYVAVTTMDMEFLSIDFNPCPISIGNQLPNYFQNIARCKPSTICEPLYGWGFRRGGYKCMCGPGYRYPPWQNGPFMGIEIESATQAEYENGFNCVPVELRQIIPVIRSNTTLGTPNINYNYASRKKRSEESEIVDEPDVNFFERPLAAKRTDRATRSLAPEVRQSRILNKKLRLLRLANLKEDDVETILANGKKRKKRSIVARTSYPYHLSPETNRRVSFVPRHKRSNAQKREKRQAFNEALYDRMQSIINFMTSVNQDNCASFKPEELQLPGDVGYNVETIFSNQARVALRLSHFLSNFLQNVDMYEEYGNLRGDRQINIEQVFGEVLANTMGDLKIRGSGVFYDTDKFVGPDGNSRHFFGPYAYRWEDNTGQVSSPDIANTNYRAVDYAGFPQSYLDDSWFKNVKERWQSNTYGLTKFREKPVIRSDINGTSLVDFLLFPLYYLAPQEQDGLWSAPYFDCDGYVNDWVVTYSIPFFGLNSISSGIEFKGVVIVDVQLSQLDINQCPMDYFVPNAFKDTARCHYETTTCTPLAGKKFVRGSYKCDCKVGFEYPYNDNQWYFDGQTVEEEYQKMLAGNLQSRYDHLQCRISGASRNIVHTSLALIILLFWSSSSLVA